MIENEKIIIAWQTLEELKSCIDRASYAQTITTVQNLLSTQLMKNIVLKSA